MNNMRNKILSLLVLLLTAASGAWAADPKVYTEPVAMSQLQVGDILAPGFSLNPATVLDVIYFDANRSKQDDSPMGSEWAVSLSYIKSYGENAAITSTNTSDPSSDLTATPVDASGNDGNAWVVTSITEYETPMGDVCAIYVSGTYYEPPITVEPVSGKTNEWTLSMPGSDVVLTPIYAKAAAFATTGTEPEVKTLLPEAAEGVIAGTDASLIAEGTGIVAFAGTSTEDTQGKLMYAIGSSATTAPELTAFSATVPTAENVADDGADVYVWYYIQGADTPDGQEATEENTFNDTEICTTPLTVTVLSNKFDLTFKAANANTIDATQASKGTVSVKVGDADAEDKTKDIADGKLTGIKMGSEVKLNTKAGYKFRKVEVKKKAAAKPLANATTEDLGKVVGADGKIYATKADAEAVATGNAVAMICYVNEGHGLALALTDEGTKDWSTAMNTCAAHTPAITGGTWKLASKDEWFIMISAAGSYSALRDGFSSVGGTNMKSNAYWSSTEYEEDCAWGCYFNNGIWDDNDKDANLSVRACLAF